MPRRATPQPLTAVVGRIAGRVFRKLAAFRKEHSEKATKVATRRPRRWRSR
jgi:hypothetical protein